MHGYADDRLFYLIGNYAVALWEEKLAVGPTFFTVIARSTWQSGRLLFFLKNFYCNYLHYNKRVV